METPKIIHNRKSVSYKKIPGGTIENNALKGDLSGYYIIKTIFQKPKPTICSLDISVKCFFLSLLLLPV